MINKRITFLFAPDVPESKNGWLAVDTRQATVVIQSYTGMSAGDRLDLYWTGDKSGEYHDYVPITQAAIDRTLDFYIPASEISPNERVTVKYAVTGTNGEQEYSQALILQIGEPIQLPAPVIDGIIGTMLYPVDIMDGATVRVVAMAGLQSGDGVTLHWIGSNAAGSKTLQHTVTSAEAGNDLSFTISANVALAAKGKNITLYYEVARGGIILTSAVSAFQVSSEQGGKELRVMGARGGQGSWRYYDSRGRRLVALDVTTLKPVEATWQYASETEKVTGTDFYDTHPWKRLHIRTETDSVALNPANICDTKLAFAALRNESDVVAWGNAEEGGYVPSTERSFTDIVGLFGTVSAFAATRKSGNVIAWGNNENGGHVPVDIAAIKDMKRVIGNAATGFESATGAFAGLRANGAIVAWGGGYGATLSTVVKAQTGIDDVVASRAAFLCKSGGSMYAWGGPNVGGTIPVMGNIGSAAKITGGASAFAMLNTNRTLFCWHTANPRDHILSEEIAWICFNASLKDITFIGFSNNENRTLGWGSASSGASVPNNIAVLDDITSVAGTEGAFVALRENGSVVAWGDASSGGHIPTEVAELRDIISITANAGAVAVLRANGEVVTWGAVEYGGDTSGIKNALTDVRAIYCNFGAFVALTGDSRVVTWGNANGGGNSSAVASKLQGQVTYEVQIPST